MDAKVLIDPAVCHGKPVLCGTRVQVSVVVGGLAGGMSVEEVAKEYGLKLEQVRAAVAYAGSLLEQEVHHPLPA
ncbi:MAG: DUF433 domain-containing protein [Verrucomicrobia bacterium]|nr:DUF433 domain-containing protein [Verrucomicrobiota bacterium]